MSDTPTLDAARTLGPEDEKGVVGIVQSMAREIGDKLERILAQLAPLPRIEAALTEVTKRVHAVERETYRLADGYDRLDRRVTSLEAVKTPRKRKPSSRKPRKRTRQ